MNNGHPTNSTLSELRAAQGGVLVGEARTFSSNEGIRTKYAGTEGGGQIRHFVGALIASSYPGGYLAMMSREGMAGGEESKADRRLNGLASYINDKIFAPHEQSGPGVFSPLKPPTMEQIRQSLADEIRRDLCAP